MNHIPMSSIITQEQFVNYCTLANFLHDLEKIPPGLRRATFNMWKYGTDTDMMSSDDMTDCGSAGCAAGHGPFAGIQKYATENWAVYVQRVFTGPTTQVTPGTPSMRVDAAFRLYHWAFSADWAATDNTPEGAARRIDYAILHGVPLDAMIQAMGEAELSYKNCGTPDYPIHE